MQWLYFDALECLAEDEGVVLTEEECAPVGVEINHTLKTGACEDGIKMVLNLFFCLFLLEEQSLRWADCSVWHQAAGFACQTALLPGELANGNLSNIPSDMLLLREI